MFKKAGRKIQTIVNRILIRHRTSQLSAREILCSRNGSGLVEYAGIAAAVLILIVVVILPLMKTMFNTDIFPGLTDQIKNIFKFS
jgi:hypothetical protein